MIIPIGDDNPKVRVPWVHYGIMAVNVAVFLYMLGLGPAGAERFVMQYGFAPNRSHPVALLTALYIHGGLAHIFFNMLFLWIVGDNVEDRMGPLGYLLFYHGAGLVGNLAHWALNPASALPVVGASGAISGVMGAYAVLFPNAKIKIFYWVFLFFMNTVYVSAKWAIGLWFLQQVLMILLVRDSGVAYDAHIGGLVFGALVAGALRKTLLAEPDTVRRIVQPRYEGPELRWEETEAAAPPLEIPASAPIPVPVAGPARPSRPPKGRRDDNTLVLDALKEGSLHKAYHTFLLLTDGSRPKTLTETTLMTLGEALMSARLYGPASRVYEVALRDWPEGHQAPEAAFRMGMILSREFRDYTHAKAYLAQAARSHGAASREMRARDELKRIDAYLRRTRLSFRGGPVWIIRQTDDPCDYDAVARTVAKTLGVSSGAAAQLVRESHGIIARDVPLYLAQTLADGLQARGVPVLMIPAREIVIPQPAVSARVVYFAPDGLRFELSSSLVVKAWRETRLIACGVVGHGEQARRVVDFFFTDETMPTHVRVVEGTFTFSYARMSRELRGNIAAFIETVQANAPDVAMNRGMVLADRDADDPAWDSLRFDTVRAFDAYYIWFLQLIGAGSLTRS